jgi:uncharacterized membrane protein
MSKGRLEAFSDGVIAIIITIMVLEMKVPHHGASHAAHSLTDLKPLWPVFLSYVLSFAYIGIYWNNHHHMLHATERVNGTVLWANLHLLFWLSLVPFVTGWMGENGFAPIPTALYGVVLLMASIAYLVLQRSILALHDRDSALARAVGRDRKGLLSTVLYVVAIVASYYQPWLGGSMYALVALIWFIPDRRIEKVLAPPKEAARG